MTRDEKLQAIANARNPMGAVFAHVQSLKGDKGDVGPQGIAGADGKAGRDGADGKNGKDGAMGPQGVRGAQGPSGADGKDGIDGRDGKNGKNGTAPVLEDIVANVLKEITSGKKLTVDHIDGLTGGLAQLKDFLKVGGYRGGGDTVAAGTGVTITIDANGHKVITATGGAGNAVYGENLTPQGPGTVYTLAHTPIAGTVRLYRGGAYQQAGTDYTIVGGIITLAVATQSGEVLLADYFF